MSISPQSKVFPLPSAQGGSDNHDEEQRYHYRPFWVANVGGGFMAESVVDGRVYQDITYIGPGGRSVVKTLTDVTIGLIRYIRTGDHDGHGVFMLAAAWPCVPGGDEGLFVFENEERMIPLADWKSHCWVKRPFVDASGSLGLVGEVALLKRLDGTLEES